MGLLKNMPWHKNKINTEATINTPSGPRKININKANMKNFIIKAIGYITSQSHGRENFTRPEYNLNEIKEAAEADSYIKIALTKYSYLIYKAGWKLKAENQKAIDYILMRFRLMSFSTDKPMDILFQEVADDLVKYSNAFLVKSRVDSLPGINAKPVMADRIVGGYFRVDPASIRIKRDKNGNILKYEQGYGENKKEFKKEDIIHFFMDKDANNAFGTPRIIAALEDVKLLRKIEGNVVALIYRFSMPLFQWIVGLPEQGFQGTDIEIEKAQREIESSTLDGVIVTNERTQIKAIGAEGTALSAEGYLKYFEERCFSALGVSASQMGRGGAKQDSESMEAQIHDTVKYIQRVMSIFIEEKIIAELLLEGGFNPIYNADDMVKYKFEEISLETKLKKENHEMLRYQSNVITFEEARRQMGIKDNVDNEERLYKNMIEVNARTKEIDRTAEHTMELEKFKAAAAQQAAKAQNSNSSTTQKKTSTGDKAPRNTKNQGPSKAATNNNRPQNQHGTTSVKVREFEEAHNLNSETHKKEFKRLYKIYDEIRNDINKGEDIDLLLPLGKENMVTEIKRHINLYSNEGLVDATKEIDAMSKDTKLIPNLKLNLDDFYEEIEINVEQLLKDIKHLVIVEGKDATLAFEALEYRIKFLVDFVLRKAYWYTYIKTGAALGQKKAYIIFNSDKDADGKSNKIDTNAFTYSDIPAYHSFCGCEVTYNKAKAGEKNGNRN